MYVAVSLYTFTVIYMPKTIFMVVFMLPFFMPNRKTAVKRWSIKCFYEWTQTHTHIYMCIYMQVACVFVCMCGCYLFILNGHALTFTKLQLQLHSSRDSFWRRVAIYYTHKVYQSRRSVCFCVYVCVCTSDCPEYWQTALRVVTFPNDVN